MGGHSERLTKVKMNNTHCSSLVPRAIHFIIEGYEGGQAPFVLRKMKPALTNHLSFMYISRN